MTQAGPMGLRAELWLGALVAGAAVAALGYLAAAVLVLEGRWQPGLVRTALAWSPSGALAASAAALVLMAWQRRSRAGVAWHATGMAARATALALLFYPLAVALWMPAATGLARGPGMAAAEQLRWLPSVVLGATLAALLAGTVPAFASAFLLCRRCLRRQACSTTDLA